MSLSKTWILLAVCLFSFSPFTAWAQQPAPAGGGGMGNPAGVAPMRNVFYNVLWGSVTGGMVYSGLNILDDTRSKGERYSFSRMTGQFVLGATYGGLAGLAAGVYFSMTDISFDPSRSRIAEAPIRATRIHGDEVLLANYQFQF